MQTVNQIRNSLRRKEVAAVTAKRKGMQTTYGNLMLEITELKRKLNQMSMGGQGTRNFS